MQSTGTTCFPFEFQSTLEADTDEKLEVMSKASHQRQKLLSYAQFANSSLLGLGQQCKECNDFLAQELGFASVGKIFNKSITILCRNYGKNSPFIP